MDVGRCFGWIGQGLGVLGGGAGGGAEGEGGRGGVKEGRGERVRAPRFFLAESGGECFLDKMRSDKARTGV